MFGEALELFLWGFLVAQIAGIGTTAYLHRSSTHKSVIFHPVVEFFLQFVLWLTTGINRKEWVAVHLYHHAFADIEGDPHSPVLLGLWKVQLGNLFLYQKAAKNPTVLAYAKHIHLTWAEKNLFQSPMLGLSIGIAVVCTIFGIIPGLIIAAVHAFLYLFLLNNLVNGWCHVRGYKNFAQALAFNNRFIALITGGEGLHNNHHYRPGRAKLSVKTSEFDLGWAFIQALFFFKLAKVNQR